MNIFDSTMARSTFNFNKTAITIASLDFLMRVYIQCVCASFTFAILQKKRNFFSMPNISKSKSAECCRWWCPKTKYYSISCVHQFSMHKICSFAHFGVVFSLVRSLVAWFSIVSFNFRTRVLAASSVHCSAIQSVSCLWLLIFQRNSASSGTNKMPTKWNWNRSHN